MPTTQNNSYEFIKSKIKTMKDTYPSLRNRADDYVLSALAIKSCFYKNPSLEFTENILLDSIVDGSGDGGADFILTDPNSESSDLIIGQSKYYATIRSEDVTNAISKMIRLFNGLRTGQLEGINGRVQSRFMTLFSEIGEESTVKFVFCTSAPKGRINSDNVIRSFSNQLPSGINYEIQILFGTQLEEEIKESESRRPTVETGKLMLDRANNCLLYGADAAIVNISAFSLKMLYAQHNINLLAGNLRYHIKGEGVDKSIRETITNSPNSFWMKNNGITIICEEFRVDGRELKLKNFSIVNGGQTTYQIHCSNNISEQNDIFLPCKVITTSGEDEDERNKFNLEIAKAANMQKAIKPADLKANAPEQIRFAQAMRETGVFYLTKRGESVRPGFKEAYKHTNLPQIGKLCLAGIFQSPASSRNKPSLMYKPKYYNPVFKENLPQIPGLCKELLYIDNYFSNKFLRGFDNEYREAPNANDILPFAHNARTVCLSFVSLASRVYQGNITNENLQVLFSPAVQNSNDDSAVYDIFRNLDGINWLLPITLFDNKDKYESALYRLFKLIIEQGAMAFSYDLEYDSTLTASNYLKKDRNYYKILKKHWSTLAPEINAIFDEIMAESEA